MIPATMVPLLDVTIIASRSILLLNVRTMLESTATPEVSSLGVIVDNAKASGAPVLNRAATSSGNGRRGSAPSVP